MKQKKKKWHKWLAAFFTSCILLGSSLAQAAPLLWSCPHDHILISEGNFLGAPGTGPGSLWFYRSANNGRQLELATKYTAVPNFCLVSHSGYMD
jgi:hypothetical protein